LAVIRDKRKKNVDISYSSFGVALVVGFEIKFVVKRHIVIFPFLGGLLVVEYVSSIEI
jgi:hypothetical protein